MEGKGTTRKRKGGMPDTGQGTGALARARWMGKRVRKNRSKDIHNEQIKRANLEDHVHRSPAWSLW